jgi:hypothetical protein
MYRVVIPSLRAIKLESLNWPTLIATSTPSFTISAYCLTTRKTPCPIPACRQISLEGTLYNLKSLTFIKDQGSRNYKPK